MTNSETLTRSLITAILGLCLVILGAFSAAFMGFISLIITILGILAIIIAFFATLVNEKN